MILSMTFSKPSKDCEDILGKPYIKVRIRRTADITKPQCYEAEFFTQKQAFQKQMTLEETEAFLKKHGGTTFKSVAERTDTEEITILANRHGEIKTLSKKLKTPSEGTLFTPSSKKTKKYIITEGTAVPFLVRLGVMTKDGKVISQRYDKFRQINRFLEYISDILDDTQKACTGSTGFTKDRPLRIVDFGCGKSYLTFAVHYFLHEIRHIPVEITGLDLKTDVITECQALAREFGCEGLNFYVGDIAQFNHKTAPDMIITLHACDIATDYALNYAVKVNAAAILSVPCCQHEVNTELDAGKALISNDSPFASLVRYGIIKERLSSLVTDALRAEVLEQNGYNVQVLEFIDMSHTPKNLLIRAVRKASTKGQDINAQESSATRTSALTGALGISQTLCKLLSERQSPTGRTSQ